MISLFLVYVVHWLIHRFVNAIMNAMVTAKRSQDLNWQNEILPPDVIVTSLPPTTAATSQATSDYEEMAYIIVPDNYDYKGASLFVAGLLTIYGVVILLFIISLIRKSRTDLEVVDHLEDFEAIRRASQKQRNRDSLRSQSSVEGVPIPVRVEELRGTATRTLLHTPLRRASKDPSLTEDVFLEYEGKRTFRNPGKIVSYNPGLLRDDKFERGGNDVIIL